MSDTRKTIWCGHCGQQTVFIIRAQGSKYGAAADDNYKDGQDITEWRILECRRCKKPTLEEVKISYEFVIDDVYGGMEAASIENLSAYRNTKNNTISIENIIAARIAIYIRSLRT